LIGLGGDDRVDGRGGNDRLFGGPGNDIVVGGSDVDVAVYSAGGASFAISNRLPPAYLVSGPDGLDALFDVERLEFSDKKIALDLGPSQAAGNTVRIIGAAFGATAIQEHRDWVGAGLLLFDGGASMQSVCGRVVSMMSLSNDAL
jgi:Ca2+-binding RTX toxin-like protein